MLTGYGDTEAAVDCLRRGAVDYLLKPPKLTDLIRAIERALAKRRIELARKRYQKKLERKVRDRTTELRSALRTSPNTYQNTLLALVAALDAREHETSDHSQRVVEYTIGHRRSAWASTGPELDEIGRGALLHDIGKIGVPDAVLLKPGKLTPEEWVEMRKHPDIGFQMIEPIPFLAMPAADRALAPGALRRRAAIRAGCAARDPHRRAHLRGGRHPRRDDQRPAVPQGHHVRERHRGDPPLRGTQFDPEVVSAFLDIGEEDLMKIKEEMSPKKSLPWRAAEAARPRPTQALAPGRRPSRSRAGSAGAEGNRHRRQRSADRHGVDPRVPTAMPPCVSTVRCSQPRHRNPLAPPLLDAQGRTMTYLRLSRHGPLQLPLHVLLARVWGGKKDLLTARRVRAASSRVFAQHGIRRVRLTGGEPLIRPDIVEIARRDRRAAPGSRHVAMTTNASAPGASSPAAARGRRHPAEHQPRHALAGDVPPISKQGRLRRDCSRASTPRRRRASRR